MTLSPHSTGGATRYPMPWEPLGGYWWLTARGPYCEGRVKDITGDMMCTVLGKMRDPQHQREGIVMSVEYKGTCKGVWYSRVATMLGMDVSLEAKGSDILWVPGRLND
ncbi:hypothetical protein B0H14DRAFT_2575450 [Mycena olivaceomarginata]|nr:hypothetical protein B0H14DRAFT_2575450 [Mycena olivaceomarginata]